MSTMSFRDAKLRRRSATLKRAFPPLPTAIARSLTADVADTTDSHPLERSSALSASSAVRNSVFSASRPRNDAPEATFVETKPTWSQPCTPKMKKNLTLIQHCLIVRDYTGSTICVGNSAKKRNLNDFLISFQLRLSRKREALNQQSKPTFNPSNEYE